MENKKKNLPENTEHKPEKNNPTKEDDNNDKTIQKPRINEPGRIEPNRIDDPDKTDPTRIKEPDIDPGKIL